MSIVQRDYLERMIEQAVQAIAQVLQLVRAGDLDLALIVLQKTRELVLGPMAPVLERVDAASAVNLVGKYEVDRLRMYAALLGEEAAIHELRGHTARAVQSGCHALELYAAISLAGARLLPADLDRIVLLQPVADSGDVDARYREELGRLVGQASPPHDGGAGIVAT